MSDIILPYTATEQVRANNAVSAVATQAATNNAAIATTNTNLAITNTNLAITNTNLAAVTVGVGQDSSFKSPNQVVATASGGVGGTGGTMMRSLVPLDLRANNTFRQCHYAGGFNLTSFANNTSQYFTYTNQGQTVNGDTQMAYPGSVVGFSFSVNGPTGLGYNVGMAVNGSAIGGLNSGGINFTGGREFHNYQFTKGAFPFNRGDNLIILIYNQSGGTISSTFGVGHFWVETSS